MSNAPPDPEWAFRPVTTPQQDEAAPAADGAASGVHASQGSPALPPPRDELVVAPQQKTRRLQSIGETKVAILGARACGKSYLFQAMTYRASNPARSGSLKVFLGNEQAEIYEAEHPDQDFRLLDMRAFNARYKGFDRLPATMLATQRWYKLLLRYRTGWLGLRRAEMCVDFLDGSGEAMAQRLALMQPEMFEMFKHAYLPARVAIFCLPLWVAFPDPLQRASLAEAREKALAGFYQIVHNFKELRSESGSTHAVRSMLALTQADHRDCALSSEVREFWLDRFLDPSKAQARARELGTQRGLMRYLRDARAVSDWFLDRFQRSEQHDLQKLPFELQFDGQLPMVIPLSAIDGSMVDLKERQAGTLTPSPGSAFPGAPRPPQPSMIVDPSDPVPAHVELPLLVALCERHNALM